MRQPGSSSSLGLLRLWWGPPTSWWVSLIPSKAGMSQRRFGKVGATSLHHLSCLPKQFGGCFRLHCSCHLYRLFTLSLYLFLFGFLLKVGSGKWEVPTDSKLLVTVEIYSAIYVGSELNFVTADAFYKLYMRSDWRT